MFAEVVFPQPFKNSFTYSIPSELFDEVRIGKRVLVPFGKRKITGFVIGIKDSSAIKEKIKPIEDVLDDFEIFNSESLKFYQWISGYYISSLGEALKNSIPYGIEVESKKKIIADQKLCKELFLHEKNKSTIKASVLEILSQKETHTFHSIQKSARRKNIYFVLKSLENIGAISILDEIEHGKVRIKLVKHVKIIKPIDEIYDLIPLLEKSSPKQAIILFELLADKNHELLLTELLERTKTNYSSVVSLQQKKLLRIIDKEVERISKEVYTEEFKELTLTKEQTDAVNKIQPFILEQKFAAFLLFGVTASGKTQVYIELAKKVLKQNKTVIILVPEISLTPQITSRFINNFGDITTVLHSRLSLGERYDAWRGIIKGKYKVVIGPRSALFAPLKNIGLIVVDEEHDGSYKQYEIAPKYNARDSAVIRAKYSSCPVILGSATPAVESMYNAEIGKYNLIELRQRIDNAKLPQIKLIDVTIEKKRNGMENVFSKILIDEIAKRISKKENVILLQNRRGFSTQVYCDDCGSIEMCDDCSVPMVHHIARNTLQCHYCGIIKVVPKACSVCGSTSIKFFGAGTQKVEDELSYYFPSAKIQRIDSDTISGKGKLGNILSDFKSGKIDILVGTQIVAKGLDFSNVTLVGVISAETTLWLPDFRADEKTFQLLTQVSGRAGRSGIEGEVIIQTQNHKNFVLQKVLANDYKGFYQNEIQLRKTSMYPPFSKIALIETNDLSEEKAFGAINDFYKYLILFKTKINILPPNPAIISRIKGHFRFQILIKNSKESDPGGQNLRKAINYAVENFEKKSAFKKVKLIIEIDPQSII